MLHRLQRQEEARHLAHLPRPETGGIDHVFGADRALLGDHVPGAVRPLIQLQHPVAERDLGSLPAGGTSVGVGRSRRVQVAVKRVVEGADHAVGVHHRAERGDLVRRDDLGLEPHVAVLGALRLEVIHALGLGGDGDAADVVEAAGLAADLLQFLVELDRVTLQLGDVGVRVEGVEAAGRVPGGARGQLRALDQQHVGPAVLGQMEEDAAADDAAPDDHDPRMRSQSRVLPGQKSVGRPPSPMRRSTKASSSSSTAGSSGGGSNSRSRRS